MAATACNFDGTDFRKGRVSSCFLFFGISFTSKRRNSSSGGCSIISKAVTRLLIGAFSSSTTLASAASGDMNHPIDSSSSISSLLLFLLRVFCGFVVSEQLVGGWVGNLATLHVAAVVDYLTKDCGLEDDGALSG
jgi:hypothetical protein